MKLATPHVAQAYGSGGTDQGYSSAPPPVTGAAPATAAASDDGRGASHSFLGSPDGKLPGTDEGWDRSRVPPMLWQAYDDAWNSMDFGKIADIEARIGEYAKRLSRLRRRQRRQRLQSSTAQASDSPIHRRLPQPIAMSLPLR